MKISVSLRGISSRLRSGGSLATESRSAVASESGRSLASARNAIHLPSGETTALQMRILGVRELLARGARLARCRSAPDATYHARGATRGPAMNCPCPFALYTMSTTWRPSKRDGFSGFVIAL